MFIHYCFVEINNYKVLVRILRIKKFRFFYESSNPNKSKSKF